MKKLIVFDLDGTLTESKQPIDSEMSGLLEKLLTRTYIGITGGGSFEQFSHQLLSNLSNSPLLSKLLLFPTNGAIFFRYFNSVWTKEYSYELSTTDKEKIFSCFEKVFQEINYQKPKRTYGPILEDRGGQITFSALGQQAPLEAREKWRQSSDRRPEIKAALEKYLPEFDFVIAGVTSIDIISKKINKGTAIDYAQKLLNIPDRDAVFVGDSLFIGGNDYLAKKSGVETISVKGPKETKTLITKWLQYG